MPERVTMSDEMDAWARRQPDLVVTPRGVPVKQGLVLNYLATHDEITLAQAVELIGRDIVHNAPHHVGAVLKRMIDAGRLVRVRKGVYAKHTKEGAATC